MKIIRDFPQGTEDWFQAHLGRATASRAADMMDFTQKGIEGAKRKLYRLEKVAEILSGMAVHDNYVSPAMKAGTEAEPLARATYEMEEKVMVEQVGIVIGDDERTAWSPDGLVDDGGAIECKGPRTTTHLMTLALGAVPEANMPQIVFAFMVHPGLRWIDFVSRDGGMSNDPEKFGAILPRRYIQATIRVERADVEAQIVKMCEGVEKFFIDVQATIDLINERAPALPEPERAESQEGMLQDSDFEGLR